MDVAGSVSDSVVVGRLMAFIDRLKVVAYRFSALDNGRHRLTRLSLLHASEFGFLMRGQLTASEFSFRVLHVSVAESISSRTSLLKVVSESRQVVSGSALSQRQRSSPSVVSPHSVGTIYDDTPMRSPPRRRWLRQTTDAAGC